MSLRTIPETEEGVFKATASGTLPNGKPVIVNSDGTVSAVDGGFSTGSPVDFSGSSSSSFAAVYDTNSNKVVIAYEDLGDLEYGKAVVGTVSGSSISFGTPVTFKSDKIDNTAIVFDSVSNQVVICYRDFNNDGLGEAVVGAVSGSSISFGTPTLFKTNPFDVGDISPVFDTNANRVVISYRDPQNSHYGTSVVGTVSGTSISFGGPVVFNSAFSSDIGSSFDSNANAVAVLYRDSGNSNYGTGIVGTVSGTSISFGTPTVFHTSRSVRIRPVFEPASGKIVVMFDDDTNSELLGVVGTVSGTSISFGSTVLLSNSTDASPAQTIATNTANEVYFFYRDSSASPEHYYVVGTVSGTSISPSSPEGFDDGFGAATWDPDQAVVVIAFRDSTDNFGKAYTFSLSATNLTTENYIGMSTGGAVASTNNATVDIIGTLNNKLSGLNPGQKYFVQFDGSLSTTAGTPEVFAGTAISATSLLVKL